jgi:hypothetical protein
VTLKASGPYKSWACGLVVICSLAFLTSCQVLSGSNGTRTLGLSSEALNFGTVAIGGNKALQDSLTNSTAAALTIYAIQSTNASFTVSSITLPLVIAAGQSVPFTVQFQPTASGDPSATVSFEGANGQTYAALQVQGDGVTPGQLAINPGSVNFGSVMIGGTQSSSVVVSNSGATDVTVTQATLSGTGFIMNNLVLPLTLAPGSTTSITITFAPPASGAYSGSVSFGVSSSQGNSKRERQFSTSNQQSFDSQATVPLSGSGITQGVLSPNFSSLSFGSIQAGTSANLSETLANSGGSPVTLSQASLTGSGFSISGPALPITLNANQSTSFTVTFNPAASGSANGTLSFTSNASDSTLNIPLSGSGLTAGSLTANPSSFSFGSVQVGTSNSLSGTLTNSGGSSLTISAVSASGSGFSISGLSLPLSLNAGQSTSFIVNFNPAAAGAATGTLTITSNGSNSTLSIPLSGTGVPTGSLSPSPTSIALGSVQIGTSSSQSETLTNNGGTSVTISTASISGTGLSLVGLSLPVTLSAGQSTSFTVTFAPTATGAVSGSVSVTSNASNSSLSIPVSATGASQGTLSSNPSSLALGSVAVGNNASLSETVTNTGGSSVTISQANVSGAGFAISGLALPTTLSPNQSVTFATTFAPTSSGSTSGTLTIVSNASNSNLSIALSGTGTAIAQLSLSQTSLSFGAIADGSSSSLSANLSATGASVTVSSVTSSSSEFALSGITLPVTIPAGQSVSFTVIFTPNTPGSASGTLMFTSSASNSPAVQSLSGSGQPWVGISWSPSSGAVRYNVYRKLSTDQNYTQISNGDTATAYTDNNVTTGAAYDYVVTAVNAEDQESGHSTMAQAVVPNN